MDFSRVAEIGRLLSTLFYKFDKEIVGAVLAVISRENYIMIGPPGTAKTMLVATLSKLLQAKWFYKLLTKFTELDEVIGPINIAELLKGRVDRIYANSIVDSDLALLDEIFNASSAILNTLLTILNERVIYDGERIVPVKTWTVFGASNRIPGEEELQALYDRFPLRAFPEYASPDETEELIKRGWALRRAFEYLEPILTMDDVRKVNEILVNFVNDNIDVVAKHISPLIAAFLDHVTISNRTRVKMPLYVVAYLVVAGVPLEMIDAASLKAGTLKVLRYLVHDREQLSEYEAFLYSHMPGDVEKLFDLINEVKALIANNAVSIAREKLAECTELMERMSSDPVLARFFDLELADLRATLSNLTAQLS